MEAIHLKDPYADPRDACVFQIWSLYLYWTKDYDPISKIKVIWAIWTFDLWPWRMILTVTHHHSKCVSLWYTHACQIWKQSLKDEEKKEINQKVNLRKTFADARQMDGWLHVHSKYKVSYLSLLVQKLGSYVKNQWFDLHIYLTLKDDTDLDTSPLRMCFSLRYTCLPNMEAVHWRMKKIDWINKKVNLRLNFADARCWQTDRRPPARTSSF